MAVTSTLICANSTCVRACIRPSLGEEFSRRHARVGVRRRLARAFFQRVRALVLLPHAIDDEHHQQDRRQHADDHAANDAHENARLGEQIVPEIGGKKRHAGSARHLRAFAHVRIERVRFDARCIARFGITEGMHIVGVGRFVVASFVGVGVLIFVVLLLRVVGDGRCARGFRRSEFRLRGRCRRGSGLGGLFVVVVIDVWSCCRRTKASRQLFELVLTIVGEIVIVRTRRRRRRGRGVRT